MVPYSVVGIPQCGEDPKLLGEEYTRSEECTVWHVSGFWSGKGWRPKYLYLNPGSPLAV